MYTLAQRSPSSHHRYHHHQFAHCAWFGARLVESDIAADALGTSGNNWHIEHDSTMPWFDCNEQMVVVPKHSADRSKRQLIVLAPVSQVFQFQ